MHCIPVSGNFIEQETACSLRCLQTRGDSSTAPTSCTPLYRTAVSYLVRGCLGTDLNQLRGAKQNCSSSLVRTGMQYSAGSLVTFTLH